MTASKLPRPERAAQTAPQQRTENSTATPADAQHNQPTAARLPALDRRVIIGEPSFRSVSAAWGSDDEPGAAFAIEVISQPHPRNAFDGYAARLLKCDTLEPGTFGLVVTAEGWMRFVMVEASGWYRDVIARQDANPAGSTVVGRVVAEREFMTDAQLASHETKPAAPAEPAEDEEEAEPLKLHALNDFALEEYFEREGMPSDFLTVLVRAFCDYSRHPYGQGGDVSPRPHQSGRDGKGLLFSVETDALTLDTASGWRFEKYDKVEVDTNPKHGYFHGDLAVAVVDGSLTIVELGLPEGKKEGDLLQAEMLHEEGRTLGTDEAFLIGRVIHFDRSFYAQDAAHNNGEPAAA